MFTKLDTTTMKENPGPREKEKVQEEARQAFKSPLHGCYHSCPNTLIVRL